MQKAIKIAAVLAALAATPVLAEQNGTLRIGVMNDMSSVYSDFQGPGSVLAAQMAVEDFNKTSKRKVEVLSADHQNKPDVGAAIARRWFDAEGVDMIVDLPNSAVALAVSDIGREKNKVVIGSGAGTAALTGAKCSPNFVHWTYDTWAFGHGTAKGLLAQGAKTFFFITADYAFGHDLEKQASDEINASGGKILGSVRLPLGTNDFSSALLQAQASKADVILLANAGGDTVNTIKQAADFNIGAKQKVVALIFDLQSVPAIGLKTAQGLGAINGWYWDESDGAREFAKRYAARHPKKMYPNHMQAGVYSATLAYLKAVDKIGSPADGKKVVDAMKATPSDDPVYGKVEIRADGRAIHPLYLLQVKAPAESKSEWDLFKIVGTVPADKAFRPLSEGGCPLVKSN
ncbi:MAG: ABC transporter substrate-binding protein [Proteobacteria bacterium]|nr:ABC transporter substrate-binding protein [Pseudomonadota bacterium]